MKKLSIFLLLLTLSVIGRAQSPVHDEVLRLRDVKFISDPYVDSLMNRLADEILDMWFRGSGGSIQHYLDSMDMGLFNMDVYLSPDMDDLLETMREDETAYFLEADKILICIRKRKSMTLVLIYSL